MCEASAYLLEGQNSTLVMESVDTIDVRYISYDIAAVVQKIKDAGLPENHAKRLW